MRSMTMMRMSGVAACLWMLAACAPLKPTEPAAASAVAAPGQAAVQRQAVAPRLYELAFSPRQQAVFVASAGAEDLAAAPAKVLRLDPADLSVQAEIVLPRRGFGVALDDAADRLYMGNALDASVTVVDLAANQVTAVVQVAQRARNEIGKEVFPHLLRELVVDRKRHRLYAPGLSARDSVLYVIDTRTLTLERVVPGFGAGAAGIALDEDGGKLYVSNLQGQVFVVDAASLAIEATWEVKADQLLNLAFDSRHQRLVATDLGSERMDAARREKAGLVDYELRGPGHRTVVIDARTGALLASIPTGQAPIAPLVDTHRDRVYVTNRDSGTVTVLDGTDYAVLRTVALPPHPNSLTLDAATGAVFVSIKEPARTAQESVAKIPYASTTAPRP